MLSEGNERSTHQSNLIKRPLLALNRIELIGRANWTIEGHQASAGEKAVQLIEGLSQLYYRASAGDVLGGPTKL
jgi:hypothetical protein